MKYLMKSSDVSSDTTEILIYGVIGEKDFWTGEISNGSKEFIDKLNKITTSKVEIGINSRGGIVFEAIAIYNALKRKFSGNITTRVDGECSSAASILLMAGDKRLMLSNTQIMIHSALIGLSGYFNIKQLSDITQDILDINSQIAEIYISKTGNTKDVVNSWLDGDDHKFNAEKAKELNLIDSIIDANTYSIKNKSVSSYYAMCFNKNVEKKMEKLLVTARQITGAGDDDNEDSVAEKLTALAGEKTAALARVDTLQEENAMLKKQLADLSDSQKIDLANMRTDLTKALAELENSKVEKMVATARSEGKVINDETLKMTAGFGIQAVETYLKGIQPLPALAGRQTSGVTNTGSVSDINDIAIPVVGNFSVVSSQLALHNKVLAHAKANNLSYTDALFAINKVA